MTDRVRDLCRLVWTASPRRATAALALAVVSSLTSVMLGVALKTVVDGVLGDDVTRVAVGAALAAVAFGTIGMGDRIVARNLREHLTSTMSMQLDSEVLALLAGVPHVEHLDDPAFLDRVNLLRGKGDELARGAWGLFDVVGLVVEIVAGAVVLASIHPLLALFPPLALPVLALSHRQARRVEQVVEETEELRRASDAVHDLFSRPASGQEMRLFGCASELDRRAQASWSSAAARRMRGRLRGQLVSLPGWIAFGVGLVGAAAWTAHEVFTGRATLGDVMLVLQLAVQLRTKVGAGVVAAVALGRALATAERLAWLRRYAGHEAAADDRRRTSSGGGAPGLDDGKGGLVLDAVSFHYPGAASPALAGVTMRMPRGSTVAIVGENGAGKTTLVKLLCQLYRPTSGRVLYGDVDLADIAPSEWRSGLSASFQDFLRLETTARASVGSGDLPRLDDSAAVEACLGKVHGEALLAGWPQGLETHLGKTYLPGVELSAGEWQKVAGARAMMRTTPRLVVLDEPTAALDPPSELAMFQRFADGSASARRRGAITVLVSHRFSTVRMADLIVVLDGGRVVEIGTHAQLLERNGRYATMFNLQAKAYA